MSNSYFGTNINIDDAFSEYDDFNLEISVSDSFWGSNERSFSYNENNLPTREFIACSNPNCKRGGLSMVQLLYKMRNSKNGDIEEESRCNGDEGSPQ